MKVIKWLLISIAVLLCLVLIAIATVIGTEGGRLWLVDQGVAMAEKAGLEVELLGLETPRLGHWSVDTLQIGGAEPLLHIEQLELWWKPRELLQKRLHVTELSAASVDFYLREGEAAPEPPEEESAPPGLPSSPLAVVIEQLQLDEVTLHGLSLPASEDLPSYEVAGSARAFTGDAPLSLHLDIQSLNDAENILSLHTEVVDDNALRLSGKLYEGPNGLIGSLAQLPEQQAIDLSFAVLLRQQHEQFELTIERLQLPFLGYDFAARGTLNYEPERRALLVKQMVLHSDEHRHLIEGGINPEDLWLDARFKQFPLDIASPWVPELESGTLSGRVQLSWVHSDDGQLPKVQTESEIEAIYNGQRIAAQLDGQLADQLLVLEPSVLELEQARLELTGQVDLEGEQTDLSAQLRNVSTTLLEPWPVPLPPTLNISADTADLHLTGSLQDPRLSVRTELAGRYQQQPFYLSVDGSGSPQQVQFDKLSLVVEATELNARGILDWTGDNTDIRVAFDDLKHTLLKLAPESVQEQYPEDLTLVADGELSIQGNLKRPHIKTDSTVSGTYVLAEQTLPYRLVAIGEGQVAGPAELDVDVQQLTLSIAGQPTVKVSGVYHSESMDMRVQLMRLPTQVLAALGVDTLQGEAEADLKLSGDFDNPQVQGFVALRSTTAAANQRQAQVPYALRAEISSEEQQLHARIRFSYEEQKVGDLHVQLPLATYLKTQEPGESMPLQLTAQGNMDLSVANLFIEPGTHELDGKLTADLTVEGTTAQPEVRGTVTLREGYYHNVAYNTDLRDITAVLEGTGESLTISKARARSRDGGYLELDGRLHWQEQKRLLGDAIELNLRAKRFVAVQTPELYAEIGGNASLQGSFEELWLKGKFNVSPLRASIDAAIKTEIPTIEVSEVGEDDEEQEQDVPSPMPRINLELVIEAGQQAYLSGRGLDTELGGRITVTGTAEDPQFVGRFETLRGRLDIFGRRFVLGDGQVRFSNDAASLRIPAVYTTDELEITALIAGTADDPKLTLSSVPDLPQDELMARLIFDKGVPELNPGQALRLATAINTLRSSGGGFDPLDAAREKLGVDALTIENEETEYGSGLTFGVGKYINEKVYVELKSSRNPAQPWEGNVQVELNSRMLLEGGTGDDGGGNARLMWKKDY